MLSLPLSCVIGTSETCRGDGLPCLCQNSKLDPYPRYRDWREPLNVTRGHLATSAIIAFLLKSPALAWDEQPDAHEPIA